MRTLLISVVSSSAVSLHLKNIVMQGGSNFFCTFAILEIQKIGYKMFIKT